MKADQKSRVKVRDFRVLIIDDHEADRVVTTMYLMDAWSFVHGLQVEYACDAGEAIAKLQTARFALAVLDWRLTDCNGMIVLQTLRGFGIKIPVVVVSGLDREDIPADIESLGAAYLKKDFMNGQSLRDAIARSLNSLGILKDLNLDEQPSSDAHLSRKADAVQQTGASA